MTTPITPLAQAQRATYFAQYEDGGRRYYQVSKKMTSRRYANLCTRLHHFPQLTGYPQTPVILPPSPSSRNGRSGVSSEALDSLERRQAPTYPLPISHPSSRRTFFFFFDRPPLDNNLYRFSTPKTPRIFGFCSPSPHSSYIYHFFFPFPTLVTMGSLRNGALFIHHRPQHV